MTLKIMTLLALATPMAMVILGLICWRFPPGGPNWILGFRSRRARAGDASWKFAQCWAGRLWFLLGLGWMIAVLLIARAQSSLPIEDALPVYLNAVGLQVVCLILVILGMNLALWIRFDRFGRVRTKKENRKEKALQEPLSQEGEYEDLPEYAQGESTDYAEEYAEDEVYPTDTAAQPQDSSDDYSDIDFDDYGEYGEYEDCSEAAFLCDSTEEGEPQGPEWI